MRLRCPSALVLAAAVVAVSTSPAAADNTVPSTVTFQVSATDGLNITAPATVNLTGSATPGNPLTGSFGNVAVTDERSAVDTSWTATAAVTVPFTTGGGTPSETIASSNINYDPGAAINPVNGPFTPGTAGDLGSTRTAFSRPSGSGNNSVGWNPTLTINVPSTSVAGTYSGQITHSVA